MLFIVGAEGGGLFLCSSASEVYIILLRDYKDRPIMSFIFNNMSCPEKLRWIDKGGDTSILQH